VAKVSFVVKKTSTIKRESGLEAALNAKKVGVQKCEADVQIALKVPGEAAIIARDTGFHQRS
jgi:ethanolamine utilization microcompartment shell protein EutS